MLYQEVTQPISGPAAFGETDNAALLTQAAMLLVLGLQLRESYPKRPGHVDWHVGSL